MFEISIKDKIFGHWTQSERSSYYFEVTYLNVRMEKVSQSHAAKTVEKSRLLQELDNLSKSATCEPGFNILLSAQQI